MLIVAQMPLVGNGWIAYAEPRVLGTASLHHEGCEAQCFVWFWRADAFFVDSPQLISFDVKGGERAGVSLLSLPLG